MRESFELAKDGPFFEWKDCLDIRLFSDCLCAAAPLNFKTYGFIEQLTFFYKYLMGYQALLMANGFFCRGGITIGSHFADENMIFSGGLVEAHQLECAKAVYPRIILSDRLIEEIQKNQESNERTLDYMLVRDQEGIVFLNHFNYTLMDAALQDGEVAALMKAIGIDGMLSGASFFERDQQNKITSMADIKKTCDHIISGTDSDHIKSKYHWLNDFIEFENGKNSNFASFIHW
ncbi:MAG: hypothetical protein JWQ54_701 [Mucilaginibacter sp.]|nr:hypothetical protein [Mucilaginibacter sp.]